jgi:hypothetical protein
VDEQYRAAHRRSVVRHHLAVDCLVAEPGEEVATALEEAAALFQPARRRVQDTVDRRFNRRRYDAAHTIQAFSARLRQQVDLDTLTAELLAVVNQTMQPTRVSCGCGLPAVWPSTTAVRAHRTRDHSRLRFLAGCSPGCCSIAPDQTATARVTFDNPAEANLIDLREFALVSNITAWELGACRERIDRMLSMWRRSLTLRSEAARRRGGRAAQPTSPTSQRWGGDADTSSRPGS